MRSRDQHELERRANLPSGERVVLLEREAVHRQHRVRQLIRGYFVLTVAVVLAIAGVVRVQARLNRDEHATCVIQARGLPASHHLSNVMRDISVFLQPTGDRAEGKLPPAIRSALVNIRSELPPYVAATARQPAGRSC